MRQRDEAPAGAEADTLQVGPSRTALSERVPPRWRLPLAVATALALGAVAGGGAVLWSQAEPERAPVRFDEHAVELMLLGVAPRRTTEGSASRRVLDVDAGILLSGLVTSTVTDVEPPGRGLAIRVPDLPVTVSPRDRFRRVELALVVTDCDEAAGWDPTDRPFTVTWRDEHGRVHLDRAGDFDPGTGRDLVGQLAALCRDGRS